MNKTLSFLFVVALIWSCQNQDTQPAPSVDFSIDKILNKYQIKYSNDTAYTEFIDGLRRVQDLMRVELRSENANYCCNVDFDLYLKSFDKLHIDPNWQLKSYYFDFGDAGRPVFFAFEKGDPLGERLYKEIENNYFPTNPGYIPFHISDEFWEYTQSVNHMNCFHTTDDPMGYFQLVVFHLIGEKYCLFWHANYGEQSIITSKEQLKELIETPNNFYYHFSETDKNEKPSPEQEPNTLKLPNITMEVEDVLQIDPTPVISIGEAAAELRIVTLGPWEGFIERTYTVSRQFPHVIHQIKTDTLVPYHCGVCF